MDTNRDGNKFTYSYSAPTESERREILEIQKQYLADGKEDKLARLRKLNAAVKNTAIGVALSFGVVGLLLFGTGMSITLAWGNYLVGIIVAVIGIFPMAAAHPVYNFFLRHGKKKYGEEIIKLTNELLNE